MDFWENIEAYINNELPEAERQAFNTALTTDAALRQSVDEQRLIINLLRQNRAAIVANETAADAPKRQRLKRIIDGYVAELPVEMSQKAKNTEGSPFLFFLKKNSRVLVAAASVALVVTASMWLHQRENKPQPTVAQTPIVAPPVDTLTKNVVPTVEKPLVIQPKVTPQYSTEKKEKTEIAKQNKEQNKEQKALETPKTPIETPPNNDAVLAVLENVTSKEYEQITEPTKGASSNAISKEDQTLLTALEAISANKPTVALEVLQGRNDEKARYYRALATLLMDKKKGKQALEALANDTGLEVYFRNKIKDVLKKMD